MFLARTHKNVSIYLLMQHEAVVGVMAVRISKLPTMYEITIYVENYKRMSGIFLRE